GGGPVQAVPGRTANGAGLSAGRSDPLFRRGRVPRTQRRIAGGSGEPLTRGLVFRFRSSHHFAAPSSANFGIKGTLAISMFSSAAYGFKFPTRDCRELIGPPNPPH